MLFSDATRAQQGDGFEEQKRNENLIWEQLQRFLSFESRIKVSLVNTTAYYSEWTKLDYFYVYLSRMALTPATLAAQAATLSRHNVFVRKLSVQICEKYCTEELEELAQAMLRRLAPQIEKLEVSFRYPWTNEKGIAIAENIFKYIDEFPNVSQLIALAYLPSALPTAKILIPKCPNLTILQLPNSGRGWRDEDPSAELTELLSTLLPQYTPGLKELTLPIPKRFSDWNAFQNVKSLKYLSLFITTAEEPFGIKNFEIHSQGECDLILETMTKYLPPSMGINFSFNQEFSSESDSSSRFLGSPIEAALQAGCSLDYLKSLESRGVDMSKRALLHSLVRISSKKGRLDVLCWLLDVYHVSLVDDEGNLLRHIMYHAADNCFSLIYEQRFAGQIARGEFKNLFEGQENFYASDLYQMVSDSRLEWLLQHQELLGADFVNERAVTPFQRASNTLGHAMFNSLHRWDKVPGVVKLILKYNDPAKMFAVPYADPNLPEPEPEWDKYGNRLFTDDIRPESPMATWAMTHYDICEMISEGPTRPWEDAQAKFLEFMFENFMEQILQVDRSKLVDFHLPLLEQRGLVDLQEKIQKFIDAHPL